MKPIQAFDHLKFKEMIDVDSQAMKGVKISGQKATHAKIIWSFKDHLMRLKKNSMHIAISCGYFSYGF